MRKNERKKMSLSVMVGRRKAVVPLFACLLACSPTGVYAYAQGDVGTSISITEKNISVKEALEQIKRQSGVFLMYQDETVKGLVLDLDLKGVTLQEALSTLCSQADLTYEFSDGHVLIRPKNEVETVKIGQQKRRVTVRGTVVDEQGNPLTGATIRNPMGGGKQAVVADMNGHFTITIPIDVRELEVAFIGMKTQVVAVHGDRPLHIVMVENEQQLSEVIVTGYQTLSKERATGAFGVINTEELESKLQPDLKSVLEGQAAGVVLDKDGNIEIRGVSTFSAEKTPLIVVDGYPAEITLDDLNPDNIANVTILKDGVAASIYGSRAANGVIVVTTKGGQKGKPRISYKGSLNIVPKPDLDDLHKASTSDYIDAEIDIFNQDTSNPDPMSKYPMGRVTYLLMKARDGVITQDQAMSEINQLRNINSLKQVEKYMMRSKLAMQHNISLSGGTDTNTYNIALNLYDSREHFLNTGESRMLLDLKNEWKPFKFMTIGVSANINYNKNHAPTMTAESFWDWNSTSYFQPYTNFVDEKGHSIDIWGVPEYKINRYEEMDGMKDWNYNPIEDLSEDYARTTNFNVLLTAFLRMDLWKGLNLEIGGNWQRGNSQYKQIRSENSFAVRTTYNDATSVSNPAEHYFPDGALINEQRNISANWTVRTQLNFRRDFDGEKHRVTALIGNEVRRQTYDYNTLASRAGYNSVAGSFIPVNIKDYNGGEYNSDMILQGTRMISSLEEGEYSYRDNRFVSWYGNGSYEYDNRFILSGSIRLDLTNFFGTDPKYRYKPLWSVGGTWKLNNEKFFNISWIDRLHLRASYGINGNISLSQGPFLILNAGSYNQTTGGVSYSVASPPNDQLRWEKTQTVNFGVDISVLQSRLNISLDYYNKKSTDLLASDAIDPTTGFTSLTKNAGAITNNGIELTVDAVPIKKRDFSWSIIYNMAYNHNKVDTYNVTRNYASSYASASGAINVAGYPADGLWGYRFAGLNNLGEMQIYNAEGEIIKPGNATTDDVFYMGSIRPKVDLSLTNRFRYRDWDLSFMFIAKLGHKYRKDGFYGSNYANRHVGERWRQAGDEEHTIYPALKAWNMDMFYFPYIDKLIGNASYLKLRDVTLTYHVPERWTNVIGMSDAKVYFQARNLFRVTAKGCDIDPETAELNTTGATGAATDQGYLSLPLPTEFYVGITFSF